jgi:hypothetical protein
MDTSASNACRAEAPVRSISASTSCARTGTVPTFATMGPRSSTGEGVQAGSRAVSCRAHPAHRANTRRGRGNLTVLSYQIGLMSLVAFPASDCYFAAPCPSSSDPSSSPLMGQRERENLQWPRPWLDHLDIPSWILGPYIGRVLGLRGDVASRGQMAQSWGHWFRV